MPAPVELLMELHPVMQWLAGETGGARAKMKQRVRVTVVIMKETKLHTSFI